MKIITYKAFYIYLSYRCSGGDGGIDLVGNYDGRMLLIQCKDVSKTISVAEIKEFIASIGIYPKKMTFCVFVSNKKSHTYSYKGFSNDAVVWVKNSDYDILLTNIFNLQNDIIAHKFKYKTENEEIEKVKEDISIMVKDITEIKEINKKIDKQLNDKSDRDNELILYCRIIIVILISFLMLYIIKFINDK
jgi:Restriction endonuclease